MATTQTAGVSAVVVMGVSGSGKTTIGRLLAARLGWQFADADDFHSPENVAKMAAGNALDDEDRRPWLERLHELIFDHLESGRPLVMACSALKREYRRVLANGDERVKFVYLKGSAELIGRRLQERSGHYMKPDLLTSQFQALEEPQDALVLDVAQAPTELVEQAARELELEGS